MVLPVFVVVVLFFALLVSYPWAVLTLGTVAYLASLPFGWLSYRDYERRDAKAAATAAASASPPDAVLDHTLPPPVAERDGNERPARLN
jgi:CDP-diacylglycerol--serine O-phosphatidyltransferase